MTEKIHENSSEVKKDLLPLYYIRFKSTFDQLSKYSIEDGKTNDEKEVIEELFKIEKSWKNANDIEQKIVSMMNDDVLDFEIERKLLGSRRYFDDDYISLYKDRITKISSTDKEAKRNIL